MKLLSFLLVFLIVSLLIVIPVYAETFGKEDNGTNDTSSTSVAYGTRYDMPVDGTITKLFCWIRNAGAGTPTVHIGYYNAANDLRAQVPVVVPAWNNGFVEADIADTVEVAGTYRLSAKATHTDANLRYSAGGGTSLTDYDSGLAADDDLPDPFQDEGDLDRLYAIYAEYTPSAAGQDLTFNLYENSKTFGSTSKNIEITRTLYETPKTWASATASFQLAYLDLTFILFGASRTFASNFLNKELTFKLFGVSKTWSSITSSFEGIAQDLTFILFESARTWASIVATLPAIVYTVDDLIPLVVLGFIIAIIALAIAIMWSR
jgi:hypothetical protein